MISREDFTSIMEDLQSVNDYTNALNDCFRKHDVDGYLFQPDCTCSTIKLLHLMFGKADEAEWIEYFVFDMDFGRKYKDGAVTDGKGKNIKLASIDDLYNLLTS